MAYVIPTFHPAHLLRGAPVTSVLQADLTKAVRVAHEGPRNVENIIVVHPSNPIGLEGSVRLALQWISRWRQLKCPVAVDVETSSVEFMGCKLWSIALSGADGANTAVAWTLHDFRTLPPGAQMAMDAELKAFLADPDIPKVFHNASFDFAVLKQHSLPVSGFVFDTLGEHHLIQPDLKHDLGFVGHTYLDVEPWKLDHQGTKQIYTADPMELLVYNAKDALNTAKLHLILMGKLRENETSSELIRYQMAAAEIAARMEVRGMPVNMALRKQRGLELEKQLAEGLAWMRNYLNWPEFNPDAHAHVARALFSKPNHAHNFVGLTPTAYTPTGAPSTSYKDVIDHLEHPWVRRFVDWKERRTAWSTIYKDESIDEDGNRTKAGSFAANIYSDNRLHVSWNPYAQKGSRWGSSPNSQNVAAPHRVIFEAHPGSVLVGADKDQLELRIMACRAGVPELIEEMAKADGDPHTLAAIQVYGDSFLQKDKKTRKSLRDGVKNVVYASIYMAGWMTVWRTVRAKKFISAALRALLTKENVRHIHTSYFGSFWQIPAYHRANEALVMRQGYISIPPFGRVREFPVLPPPMTELANWPIQTEGSDHVLKALVDLQYDLDHYTHGAAMLINHGHDALYVDTPTRFAETVRKLMNHHFAHTPIEGPAGIVDLTAEAKIGKNLLEVK